MQFKGERKYTPVSIPVVSQHNTHTHRHSLGVVQAFHPLCVCVCVLTVRT